MFRKPLDSRVVSSAVLLAVLAACSSDGGGGPEPGPDPAIAITLASSAASIPQGGSAPVAATLTRSGGFTGTVNLTVEGVPAGVTGSVGNVQTTGGTTTATVTIQVAGTTAPGTYQLTVRATGSGVNDATAPFALTVTAVAAGSYTLALNPATLSLARGASGNTTVGITRTEGFTGAVQLSVEGAPTGVTTAFNPGSATGATSTLTVTVAAGAPTGNHTLTIKGTAAGQPDRTTTLQLTVTSGGGGGGGGSVSFTVSCFSPVWAAYQDGDGPWVQLTSTTQGAYRFDVNSSRGGFAYVTNSGATAQVAVILMSKAQMTAAPINYCPNQQTKFVNASVAGLGEGDVAAIGLGNAIASAQQNGAFSLIGVATGPQDLVAFRHSHTADQGLPGNPDRGIIRRALDVGNAATLPVLDFAGSESFPAATATFTVTNLAGGEVLTHVMGYRSGASCSFAQLYALFGSTSNSSFAVSGIPAAQQQPTDVHEIAVTAVTVDANVTASRAIQMHFSTMADRNVTLPPALPVPTITTLAGDYKRLQAAYTIPAEYEIGTTFVYSSFSPLRSVVITAMRDWIGGSQASLALPDFSGVSGWDPSWAPATSATGTWAVSVNSSNYTSQNLCQADGRTIVADRLGTF